MAFIKRNEKKKKERRKRQKKETIKCGKDVEKLELLCATGGSVK